MPSARGSPSCSISILFSAYICNHNLLVQNPDKQGRKEMNEDKIKAYTVSLKAGGRTYRTIET
ncbi:MAG: hypothetical protein JW934_19870, partial [Anaerolineae bacterium]|nr:hypothetical protein [Anaerolineae bacterium]